MHYFKRLCILLALGLVFVILCFPIYSETVDYKTAEQVARNWLKSRNHIIGVQVELELKDHELYRAEGLDIYYIFNYHPKGWVIVPSTNSAFPIIAYNTTGHIYTHLMPPNNKNYLEMHVKGIIEIKRQRLSNDETLKVWREILKTDMVKRSEKAVQPLISSKWNQNYSWNTHCPQDSGGPGGYVYAGCGAVAMAQIMHYWQFPVTGTGSHSYVQAPYGTISADFGNSTYNWHDMPDTVPTEATRKILFHAGVSIDMQYGPHGSWSYASAVPNALISYFNYNGAAQLLYRPHYASTWVSILKNQLDNGMPIFYRGARADNSDGHFFVCDGYDQNDLFHFNWGWSGWGDGYYHIDTLNPGTYDFSYYHFAVVNIFPDSYSVLLAADPPDIGIILIGAGNYNQGETVSIQAITGLTDTYAFAQWTGLPADMALLNDTQSSSTFFTMPGRNVAFTAVFDPVQTEYNVTLDHYPPELDIILTGAGTYSPNTLVNIQALTDTYVFVEWSGQQNHLMLLDDIFSSSACFYMPESDVHFTAIFEYPSPETYSVNLSSFPGFIDVSFTGDGEYLPGDTVSISVALIKEYSFVTWRGNYAHLLNDPLSQSTYFTMPANDVYFEALFEHVGYDTVPAIISLENPSVKGIWKWLYNPGESNYLDTESFEKSSWTWTRLMQILTAKKIMTADISGNGLLEVIIHTSDDVLGYYSFATSSYTILMNSCHDFTIARTGVGIPKKLVFSIQQGVYVLNYGIGYTRLYTVPAQILFSSDLYRNGLDELVIGFSALPNLYVYSFATESHSVIAGIKPSQMTAGDMTGDGHFELICAFEGFGIYMFRNIAGKTLTEYKEYDDSPLFDLNIDIPKSHEWVSNSKGWQIQRITYADPMPGHKMTTGNIAFGNADELVLSMIGRTYYYSYVTKGWTTLTFAPMKTIISGRFTAAAKDDLIVCMSQNNNVLLWRSSQNIWQHMVTAGNSSAMAPLK